MRVVTDAGGNSIEFDPGILNPDEISLAGLGSKLGLNNEPGPVKNTVFRSPGYGISRWEKLDLSTDVGGELDPDNVTNLDLDGYVNIYTITWGDNVVTGDGAAYVMIPPKWDGMNLSYVRAKVGTAGTTGTTDIQVHNLTDSQDMLSTKLTIDSGETDSADAATPYVINESYDDVSEGDILRIDIDAVQSTPPTGLTIVLGFTIP